MDNKSWRGRQGNFERFLHSIRKKNGNLRTKDTDISILCVSTTLLFKSLTADSWFGQEKYIWNEFQLEIPCIHLIFPVDIQTSVSFVDFSRVAQFGAIYLWQTWTKSQDTSYASINGKRANMCENITSNNSIFVVRVAVFEMIKHVARLAI